ncbi:hypothetical protein C0Q70_12730 [Pomacea canaliculata]|uniref:Uncharacterized protein n=1 Tax=Pomacea canaliculata TaxID=400727 RepID=A0A2T7P2D4_POMCA|nr:hypothetical protein C0Q70_12730 [Pomacea canaliculata]
MDMFSEEKGGQGLHWHVTGVSATGAAGPVGGALVAATSSCNRDPARREAENHKLSHTNSLTHTLTHTHSHTHTLSHTHTHTHSPDVRKARARLTALRHQRRLKSATFCQNRCPSSALPHPPSTSTSRERARMPEAVVRMGLRWGTRGGGEVSVWFVKQGRAISSPFYGHHAIAHPRLPHVSCSCGACSICRSPFAHPLPCSGREEIISGHIHKKKEKKKRERKALIADLAWGGNANCQPFPGVIPDVLSANRSRRGEPLPACMRSCEVTLPFALSHTSPKPVGSKTATTALLSSVHHSNEKFASHDVDVTNRNRGTGSRDPLPSICIIPPLMPRGSGGCCDRPEW